MTENTQAVIATVSRVNNYIKRLLDSKAVLNDLWVKGEISNFKRHSSGHIYLTLKDEQSVLRAVMFRSAAATLAFSPSDGMKIVARGRVSVYEAGGSYQLYIEEMIPDGVGALYLEFERLKKALAAEGLFDDMYKKPIPKYPSRIGIVTAPTGAAVRDIINVASRRFPLAELVVFPALVQGAGAKESIVQGIEYFNREKSVDTLIVGRGGGSIEDLWAFNEECVARAIFASEIPVISAVGHEVDFTIADFVADMRAPTPSAAAEISVPSAIELQRVIALTQSRMLGSVRSRLENAALRLRRVLPRTPQDVINDCAQRHDMAMHRVETAYRLILSKSGGRLAEVCARLNALSPLSTLARGYAIAAAEDGTVLKRREDFTPGMEFELRIRDGAVGCTVRQEG